MGANAQTSVPTFTAGEILTAANMNISARTGIPVFADSTARDAAFGGTGEKTLAEGQFAYLESTNATQYYDGAAWQSVGTTSGLVCVKAETAFSAVASVTADSVFSSTYTNYLVICKFTTSTTNDMLMKLRSGGTSTSTNYSRQELYSNSTTIAAAGSSAQTSYRINHTAGANQSVLYLDISGPNLAQTTPINARYTLMQSGTATYLFTSGGTQDSSTQFDGIEFLCATGTISGNYAIYGYSKTV